MFNTAALGFTLTLCMAALQGQQSTKSIKDKSNTFTETFKNKNKLLYFKDDTGVTRQTCWRNLTNT